jgi:hypothetical protein
MSVFDFLKPKWAHSNSEVRKASIPKINNPKNLLRLALHDNDYNVRKAATEAAAKADNSEHVLIEILRVGKDLELRRLACEKITNQNVLAGIVKGNYGEDDGLRKMALGKLTDQKVLADVFCQMYYKEPDYAKRILNRFSDPVDAYVQLIGRLKCEGGVTTRERSYIEDNKKKRAHILCDITDTTLKDKVLDRLLNNKLSRIHWTGDTNALVKELKEWKNLKPVTQKRLDKLASVYIGMKVCTTILDVVEDTWIVNIKEAYGRESEITIYSDNEVRSPSGVARATSESEDKIVTDGSVYYSFGSSRYLENW